MARNEPKYAPAVRSPRLWTPIEWGAIASMIVLLVLGIVLGSVIPFIPASLIGIGLAQYRKKQGLTTPRKRKHQGKSS